MEITHCPLTPSLETADVEDVSIAAAIVGQIPRQWSRSYRGGWMVEGCAAEKGRGLFIHQASKSLVIKFDRLVYWGRKYSARPLPRARSSLGFDLLSAGNTRDNTCNILRGNFANPACQSPRPAPIRVESLWIETRHYAWRLTRLALYGSLPLALPRPTLSSVKITSERGAG